MTSLTPKSTQNQARILEISFDIKPFCAKRAGERGWRGVEDMEFPGVIEERACGNSQVLNYKNKKNYNFQGCFKKNSCGISMGLCFLTFEYPRAAGVS